MAKSVDVEVPKNLIAKAKHFVEISPFKSVPTLVEYAVYDFLLSHSKPDFQPQPRGTNG